MKLGNEMRGMGRYMALGIQMVVVTAVSTVIGYWLGRKTGKEMAFLIVFFFLGALGGIAAVWKTLQETDGSPKQK